MDQNQDELQAAINNITNGAGGAGAQGGAVVMDQPAGDDPVSEIENKLIATPPVPGMPAAPEFGGQQMDVAQSPVDAPQQAVAGQDFQPIQVTPNKAMYGDPDLDRVRVNALNEIRPILETVDIPAEKKFAIYKDIIELTDDKACIEPAFNCAKQVADEKTRAECLLYVIETIDSLGIKIEDIEK